MKQYPVPPFPAQPQSIPGSSADMKPQPDYGEDSYQGSGRLAGKRAVITGGDSGIGRAVALAFAREGADVLISYLNEERDAHEARRLVEQSGRRCVLVPGDIKDPAHCRKIIERCVSELGGIDILVNNAAHQATFTDLQDISDEEWDTTFRTNVHAMFYLSKAAVAHMQAGASIINTSSINADTPSPQLLAYATTKGAIQNFTGGLAQLLAEKNIRVNCVAPGPIWTPLIPSTMPAEKVTQFGSEVPMKRPGQPCELAPIYVLLASDESSYVSGATVAVTGGKPLI
ncbi:MAG: short-chain dehydrogenase/reductase [Hyphomicrobiales bacterium]|nr:short-chain dehydrogenase/reductase [Hyphomicrobiales bacterium]